jgi:hypothetical protein
MPDRPPGNSSSSSKPTFGTAGDRGDAGGDGGDGADLVGLKPMHKAVSCLADGGKGLVEEGLEGLWHGLGLLGDFTEIKDYNGN